MNLKVITLGFYPSVKHAKERNWIFMASCRKHSIEPNFYAIGKIGLDRDWRTMKIAWQSEYLKTLDATHVLYTDAADSTFFAGMDEIIGKYEDMGSPPMVVSAHRNIPGMEFGVDYQGVFGPDEETYKVPYVGGHLSEVSVAIEAFDKMMTIPHIDLHGPDDIWDWLEGWRAGWFRPMVDKNCEIFQVGPQHMELEDTGNHPWNPERPYNFYTKSWPCVTHFQGGHQCPIIWKDEVMKPWAKQWGII